MVGLNGRPTAALQPLGLACLGGCQGCQGCRAHKSGRGWQVCGAPLGKQGTI